MTNYHATDVKRTACQTDGGEIVAATGDGEPLERAGDRRDRPDDCDCWNPDGDLPCWPCYRDGFDVPNPYAEQPESPNSER